MAYACRELRTEIPEFDQVRNSCRDLITIPRVATAARLACRDVVLESDWYKNDCGTLICKKGETFVTCVPHKSGYVMIDVSTGERTKIRKTNLSEIDPKAFSLSRTLPGRALKKKDLIRFGWREVSKFDLTAVIILGLIGTLIGILLPTLNQKVYDDYIALGVVNELIEICIVIGSFMIGDLFFSIVKSLCVPRIIAFSVCQRVFFTIMRAQISRID